MTTQHSGNHGALRRLLIIPFLMFTAAVLAVCGDNPTDPSTVDSGTQDVWGPNMNGLDVTPDSAFLEPGEEQWFRAEGTVDGSARGRIAVDWSATDGSIGRSSGHYTAYTAPTTDGTYFVIGHHDLSGHADTAVVVVGSGGTPATLAAIDVTPDSAALPTDGTQQFSAAGVMSDGTTSGVSVSWSATGGTISSGGLYQAGTTAGAYEVIATHASGLADTSAVTVTAQTSNPTLAAIDVTPDSASVGAGATQQYSASGQMSDGSTTSVSVSWSATGGTITSAGVYTAGPSAGSYRVVASHSASGLADTAHVTVTAPTPTLSGVVVTPSSATLDPGQAQQFDAEGRMSDGTTTSVSVSWSATGGSMTSGGLYTAGSAAGSYRVIAQHSASGLADTAAVTVNSPPPPPGSFPQQYSISRPQLANNPGALLHGQDWQNFSGTADLVGAGFHMGSGPSAHDAASTPVVNGPQGARRAEIISDPVFGQAVRVWATDGSDGWEHTVRYGAGTGSANRAWYRVLMKFENGFTDGSCTSSYTGGESHKLIFGGYQRHIQTINDQWNVMGGPDSPWAGKSESNLPGSPLHGGKWVDGQRDGVYTSGEWYEFIAYEERLSSTHYRIRSWLRRVSTNDVIETTPVQVIRANGDPAKFGLDIMASSIPSGRAGGLRLGINRNCPLASGQTVWWMWGPYEVIDASVIADPYGLANDML